jgi:crotonobetainyl-CoA:carnitine CoA-transferase CaiB-like acyl-CoA transferase
MIGAMAAIIQTRQSGKGMELIVSQLEAVISLMGDTVKPQEQRDGIFESSDGNYVAVAFPAGSGPDDLESWCRQHSPVQAVAQAQELGGRACQVINVVDTPQADVFQGLEVHLGAEHPITGREELIAAPWRINGRRAPLRKSAPLMAEGNSHILRNILGLPEDEIIRLSQVGVI